MPGMMSDFAYTLPAIEALPGPVQVRMAASLRNEEPLFIGVLPGRQDVLHSLLGGPRGCTYFVLTRRQIVLVRDVRSRLQDETLPLESILFFEMGTILLNSWCRLAQDHDGDRRTTTLEFNAVFQREFRTAVLFLRALSLGLDLPSPDERFVKGMAGEELLRALPFKFNSVSREYWLNGESALSTVFVPVIQVPFLRYFSRVYSFATGLVLTDKQVLIVTEQGVEGSAGKYGETWTFCPLLRLRDLAVERSGSPSVRVLQLQLGARPSGVISVPFPPQLEDPIRRFVDQVHEARAKTVRPAAIA